ncbi:hypothetical protein Trisim1_012452 [Trichoderma cf. simile WF8]
MKINLTYLVVLASAALVNGDCKPLVRVTMPEQTLLITAWIGTNWVVNLGRRMQRVDWFELLQAILVSQSYLQFPTYITSRVSILSNDGRLHLLEERAFGRSMEFSAGV